ncbi:Vesicle-associated membrane protein 721 [Platanthera zijinensis]|uniref:Vesicle-associated membrane protein 721 n=1 Tax=Platanthera zijinensis TaxID=2320716 RepID=A0AAP0BKF2_9ASPA
MEAFQQRGDGVSIMRRRRQQRWRSCNLSALSSCYSLDFRKEGNRNVRESRERITNSIHTSSVIFSASDEIHTQQHPLRYDWEFPSSVGLTRKLPDIDIRPKLKEQMQYCMDHPDEISRLAKVQAQVSQVKEVMMENIEKKRRRETELARSAGERTILTTIR